MLRIKWYVVAGIAITSSVLAALSAYKANQKANDMCDGLKAHCDPEKLEVVSKYNQISYLISIGFLLLVVGGMVGINQRMISL